MSKSDVFHNKIIVGSEEWCAMPALGIPATKARVDSGAKTSSLHAFNIRPFFKGGQPWVSFEVHPLQNNRRTIIRCEAEVVDKRIVKSSSGIGEKRYVIQTELQLHGQSWPVELTLTNRDSMGYRMLLGRQAMHGRILVDPAASFLCGRIASQQIEELYQAHSRTPSGLRIGLLASNPELASNQRILEAGEERGHRIRLYDVRQCYMKLDAEHPEIHYRGGKLLNKLDAVIPRIRPDLTFYGCALVRQFESLGIYSLNSAEAIAHSRDKLYSLQHLLQNGLPIPTTGFADSPLDTDELIDMVNGAPLIVKLLEGPERRGVVLAESRTAGESLINAFKSLQANLLVQEYIRESEGKSLRLLVVDGKVVCAVERQGIPGQFRHKKQLARQTVARISTEERRLAIKAARSIGLKVAGVDMLRSRKGPLILEITSSPALADLEEVCGKDLAGAMVSAVEKQLGWKRQLASSVKSEG
ncbi:RimK family alpha-L-glutamate ligase [Pseudohongiella sp. SYSU M77423]|nr:RimK family alpha-L-glutamate ligase [Pseudohongiella sp. SYSU M77423]MDH7942646.1 RimK family alpha-L-glutamate ligase [Pseudohongiella sp. SYSU M77423]